MELISVSGYVCRMEHMKWSLPEGQGVYVIFLRIGRNLFFIKRTGKFKSYTTSTSSDCSTFADKTLAYGTNQEHRQDRARV